VPPVIGRHRQCPSARRRPPLRLL